MALPEMKTKYTQLEELNDVLVVKFTMKMLNDEENIEQLGQELFTLVEQYNRMKLAVDMSQVEYLTSSVLGKLITLHRKLHRMQGRLALFGLTEGVTSILRTSKLLSYFAVTENKDAAVAQLAN